MIPKLILTTLLDVFIDFKIVNSESIDMIPGGGLIHYNNGICFPKSCDSVEIENLLKIIFDVADFKLNFTIDEENCATGDPIIWRNIDWMAL